MASKGTQRKLTAILCADVVGYWVGEVCWCAVALQVMRHEVLGKIVVGDGPARAQH